MGAPRAFISFDFDHDADLREMLVGQSKNSSTPFEISNWSVNEPMTGNWKEQVRSRIRAANLTIVICGQHTHTANGVAAELTITREEGKPYFLLAGRHGIICTKPTTALVSDKMYNWTWDNLKVLIKGSR